MLGLLTLASALVAPPLRPALAPRRAAGFHMNAPRPGSLKEAYSQGIRPYGEESRRYRRTVYRHEDWLKHRSETRLLRNLKGTFTSGVVRSLISEVAAVVLVALVVIVWNSAAFGYYDLDNVLQPALLPAPEYLRLQLPIAVFTISSPALGLLLVFRTNSSYQRWLEARRAWGRVVSHCRNIMRQATLWHEAPGDGAGASGLEELGIWLANPNPNLNPNPNPDPNPRQAASSPRSTGPTM